MASIRISGKKGDWVGTTLKKAEAPSVAATVSATASATVSAVDTVVVEGQSPVSTITRSVVIPLELETQYSSFVGNRDAKPHSRIITLKPETFTAVKIAEDVMAAAKNTIAEWSKGWENTEVISLGELQATCEPFVRIVDPRHTTQSGKEKQTAIPLAAFNSIAASIVQHQKNISIKRKRLRSEVYALVERSHEESD